MSCPRCKLDTHEEDDGLCVAHLRFRLAEVSAERDQARDEALRLRSRLTSAKRSLDDVAWWLAEPLQ